DTQAVRIRARALPADAGRWEWIARYSGPGSATTVTIIPFRFSARLVSHAWVGAAAARLLAELPKPMAAAVEALSQDRWRVERERGVELEYVFHEEGHPLHRPDRWRSEGRPAHGFDAAWKGACKRARLDGRHVHDLRRYAATRLVRAGVSRSEAMMLLGHETESMFVRYALTDVQMLERAVAKVSALDA